MSKHMVWHYTTGHNLQTIIDDGYLDPKASVTNGERPILWFSSNQHYEPTAAKATERGKLTPQQTHDMGGGTVRFGVLRSSLCPWPKIGRRAGIPANEISLLEQSGEAQGANPKQWLGTLKKIRVADCIVEVFSEGGWTRV